MDKRCILELILYCSRICIMIVINQCECVVAGEQVSRSDAGARARQQDTKRPLREPPRSASASAAARSARRSPARASPAVKRVHHWFLVYRTYYE